MAAEGEKIELTKLCFVVGPIGADDSPERIHADWLLEMIIQPVMSDFPKFETKRADQITTPGMIDAQVINALLNADLVIADLSTHNPNAFYEIGIRHMAQKPIIHMQLSEETIPFDVSLYRAIKYSRARPRDLRLAQETLKAQVQAVTADDYQVENPVTRARGALILEQHATPAQQVIIDQIKAFDSRLSQIETGGLQNLRMAGGVGKSLRFFGGPESAGSVLLLVTSPTELTTDEGRSILLHLKNLFEEARLYARSERVMLFSLPDAARNYSLSSLLPPAEGPKNLNFQIINPQTFAPSELETFVRRI